MQSSLSLSEQLPPAQSFFLPCPHTTQRKALCKYSIAQAVADFHEVNVKRNKQRRERFRKNVNDCYALSRIFPPVLRNRCL